MKNAEATPRPWHVEECEQCPERGQIYIHTKGWLDPNELIAETVKTDRDVDRGDVADAEANAELIVRAVNAHDALVATLELVRGIISDAALTGFNWRYGDWADRLFASQRDTHAALLLAKHGAATTNEEAV